MNFVQNFADMQISLRNERRGFMRKPQARGMYGYLGLGSNQGGRAANLRKALQAIEREGPMSSDALIESPVYESAPLYVTEQPRFLNMVVGGSIAQGLMPDDLLVTLKVIEAAMGRDLSAAGQRNGPRPIDLDILLLFQADSAGACRPDHAVIRDAPDLTIPHPRMAERAFVLLPLRDLAPDLEHPTLHRTIADLAAQVQDQDCRKLGYLEEIEQGM
jgi:2-amino-4-hydroxy-6-hydroxymethyldihydropteridine diphosphokinase